jgi:hypothetical protein
MHHLELIVLAAEALEGCADRGVKVRVEEARHLVLDG